MYGFYITNSPSQRGAAVLGESKTLSFGEIQFVYHPMPKFENDKLFYEDEEKILLLDGVIFNQRELMSGESESWQSVVDGLYRYNSERFFSALRGSFCGAVLEKKSGILRAFTNHSGEKTVYYTVQGEYFVVASHNNILTEILRENGLPVAPDTAACKELVALGSFLQGKTPFQGVRRVTAGRFVTISDGQSAESQYHMFRNIPEHEMSLDECIDELDKRFRKAVDRIFSKNREYGYQGECDLSAGTDSRMASWVAHDLGYQNLINICYSHSGNLDHTVSQSIANALNNEYIFIPLNSGDFLTEVDEAVDKLGGQVTYLISTGANRAMKKIKDSNVSICVTGLLGELAKGDWAKDQIHTPPCYTENRYSSTVPFEPSFQELERYENREQLNFYEHGLPLMYSSLLIRQHQCEGFSPFLDVDCLEFLFRIPIQFRSSKQLMMKWMVQKYPKAAEYVWQTKRMPVSYVYYHKRYWPAVLDDVRTFGIRCINKAGRILNLPIQLTTRQDMNPFDIWYRTNPALRKFVQSYYQEKLPLVKDSALHQILTETFSKGAARDKLQVINLLAVYHRYFEE